MGCSRIGNHLRRSLGRPGVVCAILIAVSLATVPGRAEEKLQFNRDIRPILTNTCFLCHGPDSSSRKAELRLDLRDAAIEDGAIVPGKPEESLIVERIFSETERKRMPPPSSHKTLTREEKERLKRWIAEGAEYQPHWAFIAPRRPPIPAVRNAAWVRNPVDSFILATLEASGLDPAPEADRRTLARRSSLDLTGLPPEPADVEAFAADPSPDAYERWVDRLLATPQWGEHRGRHWLDYARYADTHGIHFDNYREMWSYRDWVINAFNKNQPFDQLTIEQLAGDLLPESSLEQKIASGFNRCNITTNEGGVIPEEYLVLYTRDRTETAARVFMGLTANCAVCHDHKYDPLAQREFYQMAAFFNNTTQGAMDGNIKDTPPVVFVPLPEDRTRWDAVVRDIATTKEEKEKRSSSAAAEFERWIQSVAPGAIASGTIAPGTIGALIPRDKLHLDAPLSEGGGGRLSFVVDGQPRAVDLGEGVTWDIGHVAARAFRPPPGRTLEIPDAGDFDFDQPFTCSAWIKLSREGVGGAIVARMDESQAYRGWDLWLENGALGSHIIHRWQDDALKVVARQPLPVNRWVHVAMAYDGSGKPEGVHLYVDGQLQTGVNVFAGSLKSTIRTTVPFKVAQRSSGQRIDDLLIHDLKIFGRSLPRQEVEQLARASRALFLAGKPAAERTAPEKQELFEWWLPSIDEPYRALAAKLSSLEGEGATIRGRGTVAHVSEERKELPRAYILFRGEYDKRRDEVQPGTPAFLPPMPPELPRQRLGFAKWLLQPGHPLMARVTVNRFWQEVFGTGLVKTSEDFGMTGELPSHPELLDWLAVEFRENGWDVKRFFKLLVMSATYRQAALATPVKLEKDPYNRLLSRGPRFRMDAEEVRDLALSASGLLVRKIGGPSVKTYQPDGIWEAVAIIGSDTRDYKQGSGEALYRRSMYTFWKRSAPPASMEIFNAPSREVCIARRERTNTPLQALVALNDTQFVEAARALAQAAMREAGDSTEARLDFMAKRLVSRPLEPAEAGVLSRAHDDFLEHYRGKLDDARALVSTGESRPDPAMDPAALAAWTLVANSMMNLDEVLNK